MDTYSSSSQYQYWYTGSREIVEKIYAHYRKNEEEETVLEELRLGTMLMHSLHQACYSLQLPRAVLRSAQTFFARASVFLPASMYPHADLLVPCALMLAMKSELSRAQHADQVVSHVTKYFGRPFFLQQVSPSQNKPDEKEHIEQPLNAHDFMAFELPMLTTLRFHMRTHTPEPYLEALLGVVFDNLVEPDQESGKTSVFARMREAIMQRVLGDCTHCSQHAAGTASTIVRDLCMDFVDVVSCNPKVISGMLFTPSQLAKAALVHAFAQLPAGLLQCSKCRSTGMAVRRTYLTMKDDLDESLALEWWKPTTAPDSVDSKNSTPEELGSPKLDVSETLETAMDTGPDQKLRSAHNKGELKETQDALASTICCGRSLSMLGAVFDDYCSCQGARDEPGAAAKSATQRNRLASPHGFYSMCPRRLRNSARACSDKSNCRLHCPLGVYSPHARVLPEEKDEDVFGRTTRASPEQQMFACNGDLHSDRMLKEAMKRCNGANKEQKSLLNMESVARALESCGQSDDQEITSVLNMFESTLSVLKAGGCIESTDHSTSDGTFAPAGNPLETPMVLEKICMRPVLLRFFELRTKHWSKTIDGDDRRSLPYWIWLPRGVLETSGTPNPSSSPIPGQEHDYGFYAPLPRVISKDAEDFDPWNAPMECGRSCLNMNDEDQLLDFMLDNLEQYDDSDFGSSFESDFEGAEAMNDFDPNCICADD